MIKSTRNYQQRAQKLKNQSISILKAIELPKCVRLNAYILANHLRLRAQFTDKSKMLIPKNWFQKLRSNKKKLKNHL